MLFSFFFCFCFYFGHIDSCGHCKHHWSLVSCSRKKESIPLLPRIRKIQFWHCNQWCFGRDRCFALIWNPEKFKVSRNHCKGNKKQHPDAKRSLLEPLKNVVVCEAGAMLSVDEVFMTLLILVHCAHCNSLAPDVTKWLCCGY